MMSTLQDRKSEHGIEYVKNMLSAVSNDDTRNESNPNVKIFSKRKRNDQEYENIASTSATSCNELTKEKLTNHMLDNSANINNVASGVKSKIIAKNRENDLNKSLSGEELHRKAKRSNKCKEPLSNVESSIDTSFTVSQKSCEQTLHATTSSSSGVEDEESSAEITRSAVKKRETSEKKSKRVKSKSRKASSTEQAPEKRTKTSTTSNELSISIKEVGDNLISKLSKSRESSPSFSKNKLKSLSKLQHNNDISFQLPIACTISLTEKNDSESQIVENGKTTSTKIVITTTDDININPTTVKNKVVNKTKNQSKKNFGDNKERIKILSATKVQSHLNLTDIKIKTQNDDNSLSRSSSLSTINETAKALKEKSPKIVHSTNSENSNTENQKKLLNIELEKKKSKLVFDTNQSAKLLFGVELKSTKNVSAQEKSLQDKTGEQNNKVLNNSSVSSMLKKLEQNNSNNDTIKMAVTSFISVQPKRHSSAENLLTDNDEQNEIKKVKRKLYNSTRNKTTTVTLNVKEEEKTNTEVETKTTILSKTVTEQNISLKKISTKKITILDNNDFLKHNIVDLESSNVAELRQRLHSITTLKSKEDQLLPLTNKKFTSENQNQTLDANYNEILNHVKTEKIKIDSNKSYNSIIQNQTKKTNQVELENKQLKKVGTNNQKLQLKSKIKTKFSTISTENDLVNGNISPMLKNESKTKSKVANFQDEESSSELDQNLLLNNTTNKKLKKKVSLFFKFFK